jgi:hypothetical protein
MATQERIQQLEERRLERLIINNYNNVSKKIALLEKKKTLHQRRWFWELLQNAKDAKKPNEKVSIKLEYDGEEIIFSHKGLPFSEDDIIHVIEHGSTKRDDESKTGQFGTGLITTHLLSLKVRVIGRLDTGEFFNFILDRTLNVDNDSNEKSSFNNFTKSLTDKSSLKGDYTTSFIYKLDDEGKAVADETIGQLKDILPLVMSFNDDIGDIEIINKTDEITVSKKDSFTKIDKKEHSAFYNRIYHYEISNNDNEPIPLQVLVYNSPEFEIAIPVTIDNSIESDTNITIIPLGNIPKLFYDFPLFGTEKTGFPFAINSKQFDVYEERNNIYLGDEDKEEVKQNKLIIENALKVWGRGSLSSFLNPEMYFNYSATKLQDIDEKWMNKWLRGAVKHTFENHTVTNQNIPIAKLKIPYPFNEKFHSILKSLFGQEVLHFEILEEWKPILDNIVALQKTTFDKLTFSFTVDKICEFITERKTVERLQTSFANKDIDVFEWLNSLYAFFNKLKENDAYKSFAFDSKKIYPNQLGEFVTLTQLDFDDNINEKIKEIAKDFDCVQEPNLLDKRIKKIKPNSSKNNDKTINEIESYIQSQDNHTKFSKGLAKLLKWKIDNKSGLNNIKNTFITTKDKDERRSLFVNEQSILLASALYWNEKFPTYEKLVEPKFVLSGEYFEYLTKDDINYLANNNLLYSLPYIVRHEIPTQEEFDLLIAQNTVSDKVNLPEVFENVVENKKVFTFSDVPYLSSNDKSIFIHAKKSIDNSIDLLNFVILELLDYDDFFDKRIEVEGYELKYEQCYWVQKLKSKNWVKYKTKEAVSIPSTTSISPLLSTKNVRANEINNSDLEKRAKFFNILGMSISDVYRNRIKNDDIKLNWDLLFVKFLTNKRFEKEPQLAQQLLDDDKFLSRYEEQIRSREQIKTNRDVGVNFENIFKGLFKSDEFLKNNYVLDRRPVGRDFEFYEADNEENNIEEFDLLGDNKEEELITINSYMIELKTTKSPFIQMSNLQGKNAILKSDKFILAVLPINDKKYDTEQYVKKHVKFITNIGELLKPISEVHSRYEEAKKAVKKVNESNIHLELEKGIIKFKVDEEIWESDEAKNFDEFIDWLKNKETKYKNE